ncbi:MAG: EamA family transporter [Candidatus Pacearchaeota archaeon]|nr:MAG: EamA family transporter [Candidatus Pacearchaeota archaeon]
MLWLILVLVSVFIWALVNIYDKHIITDELRDPFLCTTVCGIITFILFAIIVFLTKQEIWLPRNIILTSMGAGICLGVAIFFYYKSLSHEEVSRVMPMLELVPLFTLILATIFLNEFFTLIKYIGMAFLIAGGFLISIKKHKKKSKKWKDKFYLTSVIITVLIAAIFFATRSVLLRYSTLYVSTMQIIFWVALGEFLVALILFIFHHPHIIKKTQLKGFEHLVIISIISALTFILYIYVIQIAPAVSLVSVFGAVQGLFVFIIATILSKTGKIVREPLKKGIIIQKIMAIIMIIGGIILITL